MSTSFEYTPVIDVYYWVVELAKARKELADVKTAQAKLDAEIDKVIRERYGHVLDELEARREFADGNLKAIESNTRDAALERYEGGGGAKQVHPAVTIRVGKEFEYDEQQAKEYCLLYLPDAVKLHKPTFKKHADGLAFVKTVEKLTPAIKRDLSEFV